MTNITLASLMRDHRVRAEIKRIIRQATEPLERRITELERKQILRFDVWTEALEDGEVMLVVADLPGSSFESAIEAYVRESGEEYLWNRSFDVWYFNGTCVHPSEKAAMNARADEGSSDDD